MREAKLSSSLNWISNLFIKSSRSYLSPTCNIWARWIRYGNWRTKSRILRATEFQKFRKYKIVDAFSKGSSYIFSWTSEQPRQTERSSRQRSITCESIFFTLEYQARIAFYTSLGIVHGFCCRHTMFICDILSIQVFMHILWSTRSNLQNFSYPLFL